MHPVTLEDWQAYIEGLPGGESLRSKAIAASSLTFVRALLADGLSPDDVTQVLVWFAERLQRDGQLLPGTIDGVYIDYGSLMQPLPRFDDGLGSDDFDADL